jgi:hypothetical protein
VEPKDTDDAEWWFGVAVGMVWAAFGICGGLLGFAEFGTLQGCCGGAGAGILILAAALMTGPPQPSGATLKLTIHLGRDRDSRIIRSELSRQEPYFLEKRLRVETSYRLTVDEEANDRPSYQIGRGDREFFRRGSFRASGCFMAALASIVECDRYERENDDGWSNVNGVLGYDRRRIIERENRRPVPWPPLAPAELKAADPASPELPVDDIPVDFFGGLP